ncbi:MAG: hypothetical protein M1835_008163 [Candelina submexicana]|nr:MAG: hypothetical protein M1835_008163 [Candelina submexicana]
MNTLEPGSFRLPLVSTSPIKPKMSSMEALHSVRSQDASQYTSQSPPNHNSPLPVAPRDDIAASQQSLMTHQASTYLGSFPTPVAPLALSSHEAFGSQAQSSYLLRTPNGLVQIPVDLESGSRSSDKKRSATQGLQHDSGSAERRWSLKTRKQLPN